MIYVGVDWAEAHHDICVLDELGEVLGRRRIADSLQGVRELTELVATHAEEPGDVVVGIEKDRGLIVTALLAAGWSVYAVNPLAASRYRDRHHTSGSKSDPGDAKMLADLVRTDRHNHRQVAGDTTLAQAVRVLARAHQNAIWSRQRQVNQLRNALREYYPAALEVFGTELAHSDAVAVLELAPTPALALRLSTSRVAAALKRGGRQRNLDRRAAEIVNGLKSEQLRQPEVLEGAYGATTRRCAPHRDRDHPDRRARACAPEHFEQHPSAKTIRSLPGLGMVLGARAAARAPTPRGPRSTARSASPRLPGGQRDPGVGVQMVHVRRVDQPVHRGVDRRRGAPFAVQAEVERRDHLVLPVHPGIDVDQRPQPVKAQHRQARGPQRAQVTARALDPHQLDVLAG